ncbi:NTPase [Staphylococcus aureus]|uniref:NTPase n=1 Tax=Staphylococcus aureus TaxID=1280 RepID=A0A380EH68_STAAU|nr:NTPase [Staphylococcus aureus]
MKRLKETQIYAVNPLADQLQLFYQCLHGNDYLLISIGYKEQRQQV